MAEALSTAVVVRDADGAGSVREPGRPRARFLAAPDADGFLALPEAVRALTDREREVTALAAYGKPNTEIAEQLVLSPLTVRSHIQRAMTKLNARDRAQLVVIAYQRGLAKPSPQHNG